MNLQLIPKERKHNVRCEESKHPKCKCRCGGKEHGGIRQEVEKELNRREDERGNIVGYNFRTHKGGFHVFIDGKPLDPKPSQKLINHSPDGFAWGYGGSGPAQLALAVLLYFTHKEFALTHYQDFKWDVIAGLPQGDFVLDLQSVNNWINQKG